MDRYGHLCHWRNGVQPGQTLFHYNPNGENARSNQLVGEEKTDEKIGDVMNDKTCKAAFNPG